MFAPCLPLPDATIFDSVVFSALKRLIPSSPLPTNALAVTFATEHGT